MPARNRVLLFDFHDTFVEKIGMDDGAFWAQCYAEAFREVLGVEEAISPDRLWQIKFELELAASDREGQEDDPDREYEHADIRILEQLVPQLMAGLDLSVRQRLARVVRKLHWVDHAVHRTAEDMEEFMRWSYGQRIKQFLMTAQRRQATLELLEHSEAPVDCIAYVYSADELRVPKTSTRFLKAILGYAEAKPDSVLVVGNNPAHDTVCTKIGIPALILDREGTKVEYCLRRGRTLRGVPILREGDPIPREGPFVAFSRSAHWFQEIIAYRLCTAPAVRRRAGSRR